jgi:acyl-CoA reductase-like NAD-dependent aldehyde dehydrogenase
VDEAMDVILGFPKPLAFYVFSTKKEVQERLVIGISAGGMGVNETIMHVSIILTTSSIVLTNYVNHI